jgi:hypothetical protein
MHHAHTECVGTEQNTGPHHRAIKTKRSEEVSPLAYLQAAVIDDGDETDAEPRASLEWPCLQLDARQNKQHSTCHVLGRQESVWKAAPLWRPLMPRRQRIEIALLYLRAWLAAPPMDLVLACLRQ